MSRRLLVVLGTATAAGVLAVGGLALLGSTQADADAGATAWAGWTGRVDPAAQSAKAAMTPDDAVAVALLARSARASSALTYQGRAEATTRGTTTVTDLVHVPGLGTVATVQGQGGSPRFEPEGRSGSFADDGRQLALLRINYRVLRMADLDVAVAGRPADAVVAVDAEGAVAARYWLDHRTGLLLRKQLVSPDGSVWSTAGFTSLSFAAPRPSQLPSPTADSWSAPLDAGGLRSARQGGCACPDALPGGLTLLDSRRAPAGAVAEAPVVHQVFSDGLQSVSLFSLAGTVSDADADGLRSRGFVRTELDGYYAWVRAGAGSSTATVVWECSGSVLTLVTDDAPEPLATAAAVLAALPPTVADADGSFGARVARGWQRITGGSS